MNKYTFWILLITIIVLGAIIISGILGYAWINSPTVLNVEVGFDNESLKIMNTTMELSESFSEDIDRIDEYKKYFEGILYEIQK